MQPQMTPLNAREAKVWAKCPTCIRFVSFTSAGLTFHPKTSNGQPAWGNDSDSGPRKPQFSADLHLVPCTGLNAWWACVGETKVCIIANVLQLRQIIKLISYEK